MQLPSPRHLPPLDENFLPAALWNRAYRKLVEAEPESRDLHLALARKDGTTFHHRLRVLPHEGGNVELNRKYVERTVKFLLWMKGGSRLYVAGNDAVATILSGIYSADGARSFDCDIVGHGIFDEPISVTPCQREELPPASEENMELGRNLDGCRIGFDLGGSDRKAAALIDGKVVFSEEIPWDPYFQSDPHYHLEGIRDSLQRAAAHLPRVDAIGGSAAGDYINNEVRVASLFRGIKDPAVFETEVRPIFRKLQEEWEGIPFEVINDGEVTALAGSLSMNVNAVLGISMGTSLAAGYCTPGGRITPWINELAFAPIDYRDDAPKDEWSGDIGCGVQYFSQQGIARLAPSAGFAFGEMAFPEQLAEVQKAMTRGHDGARRIYETIGVCFGYTIAHYAEFYEIENLLILGRVTSGAGGELILEKADEVLQDEFPELGEQITMATPDEQMKRHGQAVAAASLPTLAP
ncbi:MAG: transcriptional regulator [Roseibacillus sp.]|jgi:predicted NBD/HSP70 family sugar kinase|nr:transcriptional regulator [Roseibacillus sp.]MCP4729953.1 ROK family protein [Roseibacillus sp.]MDP7495698.1 ROK family protein [Roseibacillus sp.]MDP7656211.1 ROK family protein [Roseibacillus sp.]HJM65185.1 ROK family protein [Roseibacillus sp.]|tara:strand:+ start:292 stop:1686 length:1395 start_codon:yes stop_codon:yes gene_type:complete